MNVSAPETRPHDEKDVVPPAHLPAWLGYVMVVLLEIGLTVVLLAIGPVFPEAEFRIPYILITALAAYLFGVGPAILSVLLGILSYSFTYVPPREALLPLAASSSDWAMLFMLLTGMLVLGWAMLAIRRLTARLQEGEQDLKRAQSIGKIGSWRLDVRRNELLWSDQTYRIFGIPRGTPLTYEFFVSCVHPDDRSYVDGKWQAALRGETYDIEHRICVDHTMKWIRETAELEFGEPGILVGGFGTAQDITDRKLTEEELRESEKRFRDAVEGLLDPFAIGTLIRDESEKPSDFLILYANARALEFLETTADKFISARLLEVFPAIRTLGLFDAFVGVAETGRALVLDATPFEETVWGKRPGRTIDLRATRVDSEIVVSWRDVSERSRAKETLERTLEEAQRDRHFIAAIEGVSEAALSAGSLEEVLQAITIKVREGMGTHSCTLFLLDQERQELEAVAACKIPEIVGFRIPANEDFVGKILQSKHTVYIRDVQDDPMVVNPHVKRAGLKSLLGAPLIGRRSVVGVIYVDEIVEREFTPEERRLLETLASRTALVIETAQLLEELNRNFSMLQRALLPPAPREIPGYRLATTYRPGIRGTDVGGDFYDVSLTEAGKAAILIGDVSGKGIPSVSLAAATRSMLRAFIYESSSPGEALTHANTVIGPEKDDPSLFVTTQAAVIDLPTGRLCYSSAGHPPPAIYRRDTGEVGFLEGGDLPVGVLGDRDFLEMEATLGKGDKIVFYTDGLDEARRGTSFFGYEGIERVLRESGERSPDEIVAALMSAALDWAEGDLLDDTAIIVIERMAD